MRAGSCQDLEESFSERAVQRAAACQEGNQSNRNPDILLAPGQKPEGKGVSLHSQPSQHRASWRLANGSGEANRKYPA